MRCRKGLSGGAFGIRFELVLLRFGQQPPAQVELGSAMAVGEEAVVADAMKAVRQRVQQEAPDELVGVERHDLRPAATWALPHSFENTTGLVANRLGSLSRPF